MRVSVGLGHENGQKTTTVVRAGSFCLGVAGPIRQNQSLFPFAIAIAWENKPKSVLVFSERRDINNSSLSSCSRKKDRRFSDTDPQFLCK